MVLREAYVLARNAAGRATLQHKLVAGSSHLTLCGCDTRTWSRVFTNESWRAILCLRCVPDTDS